MVLMKWLNRLVLRRPKLPEQRRERRLTLMRLEQRRVLNADFAFDPTAGLSLSNVDGDLTIREVSGRVEFDLTGSIWQETGSSGLQLDHSNAGHSVLSIDKVELLALTNGLSIDGSGGSILTFDTQANALDWSSMSGSVTVQDFGTVQQSGANGFAADELSVSAADHIALQRFSGDRITLSAAEIDFTGGENSIAGTRLTISSGSASAIELGGQLDHAGVLDFTDSDLDALDSGFQSIRFAATTSGDSNSMISVDETGADFSHALISSSSEPSSLHLVADAIHIDGELTVPGGLIEVSATDDVMVSETGSLVSHGGQVHVDAGESGTLLDSGRIDVSNSEAGGVGGTVHLLGEQIGLFGDAEVNASGHGGGGEVLIGGDLHGDNDSIPHAERVFVGHDVAIHADALHDGDGGKIVLWSDDSTQFYGTLTARGGWVSGDGGLIETSSHGQLILTGGGDASAANGNAGTWLLDPFNITIVELSSVYGETEFDEPPNFNPTIQNSEVTVAAIRDLLRVGTNVIISTEDADDGDDPVGDLTDDDQAGDVTFLAELIVDFENVGDSATLIVTAANDIFINAGVSATNGMLTVILQANSGDDDLDTDLGDVNINANIDTNGGFFSSTGVTFDSAGMAVGNTAATITATGGLSITHTGTVDLGALNTGMAFGGTTFISGANVRGNIDVGEGNVFIDGGNPDLVVLADITATETIFLLADRDVIVQATVTAGSPGSPLNPDANLSLTADADSNGIGGFWLREDGDTQLNAGGNISIVGAELIDLTGNTTGTISLRIDADGATDPQIVAGQDLTIVANFGNVSGAGDIVIDGLMQATDGAFTAFFTGTTFLSADQSAGTELLFQNAVRLIDNVSLTAGTDVIIANTIDDDDEPLTGSALTVTAGGDALFVGQVGGVVAPGLDALTVTSDGLIDFLNSVTVDGNIQVTSTSETDRITFQDVVTTTNGGSVTITNAGLLVTSSSAQFNLDAGFLQNGDGSTELGAGITTQNGNVTFEQAVVLTDAVTIDTGNSNRDITFEGTIDSEVAGANEVQVLSLLEVNGGNFTISWGPTGFPIETTGPISFAASAEDVQLELAAFDSLGPADIQVLGDGDGVFTLIFKGAYRGTDVDPITATDIDLTGSAPAISVLTIVDGLPVVAEHNPLTLIAGTGEIHFQGDIGTGFIDQDLGVDGDQSLGNLTVTSADLVTFNPVAMVVTAGAIDIGAGASVITNGIAFNGGPNPTEFQSGQSIRINGQVTSDSDLSLLAAGDVTLTDDGSLFTNSDHSVSIVADTDGNGVGDFLMGAPTEINAGAGFIDVRAAEVFLGKLTSTSVNPADAENPAIRIVATFRSINDINDDVANLVAKQRTVADDPGAGVVLEAVLGIGSTDNALETEAASLSAFNHDRSEFQVITLQNANGGTFTLSWDPPGVAAADTTAPIPFNASADQVKVAFLETFDTLTDADLSVTGKAGGPYLLTFLGALQMTDVPLVTTSNVDLIGVGASITSATISDPLRAENNIIIRDPRTTDERVDLIFVHNQANQLEQQFAVATEDFGTGGGTVIRFSAATPGLSSNDIELNFTSSPHLIGPTVGVPTIVVTGHTIDIDLDSNGTTANALRDAINSTHQANLLVRAFITTGYQTGFNDISAGTAGPVALTGAGVEDGLIDINIEDGDLRVVADNSRLVLLEMRKGIDSLNPPDLAVAAVQSENTIKLTANTIEVFDDILAIQAKTQITEGLDDAATTLTVIDPSVFTEIDGTPFASPFLIQIDSEVMRVTSIDGNDLELDRGQNGTLVAAHVAGTIITYIDADNGIREHIEIQARVNFVLGADRVISTDDHYINSLNLGEDINGNGKLDRTEDSNGDGILHPSEDYNLNGVIDVDETTDTNGNGVIEAIEDFNHDGILQFNVGEDLNRNGKLDPGEDTNGDGFLQLRGNKPAIAAGDDFFSQAAHDVIHITANSDLLGTDEGRVLLGQNSTISTDNGIEQQISPRPVKTGADLLLFTYEANTAFFSGKITVSNLESRFLSSPEQFADGQTLPANSIVYLGRLSFTIGVPGEKNLVLDIDWGDHDRTDISPVPPTLANAVAPKFVNGVYVFDHTKDQHATRFLIPEGGAMYSIPHDYADNSLNLKNLTGNATIIQPGRTKPTDPFQVRFAVSQHSSIVIDGQSVLDPSTNPADVAADPADVPQNALFDSARVNAPYASNDPSISPTGADSLFQLSSTDVLDDPDAFLPRFDNGVVTFTIPTTRASAFVPQPERPTTTPELPKLFPSEPPSTTSSQLTTESTAASVSSSTITTDEFFELRRLNIDGTTTVERLNEFAGEGLLERSRFEDFVREMGDGEYEIWFITRETRSEALIERPVIRFRLESGRLAPPANDSPTLFKPFRLIPIPKALPPDQASPEGDIPDKQPDAPNDESPKSTDDKMSVILTQEYQLVASSWISQDINHDDSERELEMRTESRSSESSPMAAGLLMLAGTRWRKSRSKPAASAPFSRSSRLARKRAVPADDQ